MDPDSPDDTLRLALHRWKYNDDPWVGLALAREFARSGPPLVEAAEVVVAAPADPSRARSRGFDQGSLLARRLARHLNLPFAEALRRRRSPSQTALGRTERAANARTAFRVVDPSRVRGRRVLLCDDVLTTGATAEACAQALLDVGTRNVEVLTLARARRAGRPLTEESPDPAPEEAAPGDGEPGSTLLLR